MQKIYNNSDIYPFVLESVCVFFKIKHKFSLYFHQEMLNILAGKAEEIRKIVQYFS